MTTNASLQRALQRVNETLRRASFALLGDDGKPATLDRRATGVAVLDDVLGGGFVKGRVVELFGPPGGGKTSLALAVIAGVQRAGGTAAFIDAEGSLDASRAAHAGCDLQRLVAARPAFGEEALQIVDALLKKKAADVVVVDSVAALVPKAELLAPLGESPAGLHARLMSQSLRRIVAASSDANANVLFLNQQRTTFDQDGRASMTTTGGSALHFYAATRLEVKRAAGATLVRVVKDRFGAEGASALFDLDALAPTHKPSARVTSSSSSSSSSSLEVAEGDPTSPAV